MSCVFGGDPRGWGGVLGLGDPPGSPGWGSQDPTGPRPGPRAPRRPRAGPDAPGRQRDDPKRPQGDACARTAVVDRVSPRQPLDPAVPSTLPLHLPGPGGEALGGTEHFIRSSAREACLQRGLRKGAEHFVRRSARDPLDTRAPGKSIWRRHFGQKCPGGLCSQSVSTDPGRHPHKPPGRPSGLPPGRPLGPPFRAGPPSGLRAGPRTGPPAGPGRPLASPRAGPRARASHRSGLRTSPGAGAPGPATALGLVLWGRSPCGLFLWDESEHEEGSCGCGVSPWAEYSGGTP